MTWPPTSVELVGRGVRLTRVEPPADAAALYEALDVRSGLERRLAELSGGR